MTPDLPIVGSAPRESAAGGRLDLASDSVHSWWISPDGFERYDEQLFEFLSPPERKRSREFRFRVDRERYVLARASLRLLLKHYAGAVNTEFPIEISPMGKPFAPKNFPAFSVSHSANTSILAFSRHQIGIDIERIRKIPEIESIAANFLSAAEAHGLSAVRPEDRELEFLKLWTRKEAYLKAAGAGLSGNLRVFSVSLQPDGSSLIFIGRNSERQQPWKCLDFRVGGYVIALALKPFLSAPPPRRLTPDVLDQIMTCPGLVTSRLRRR